MSHESWGAGFPVAVHVKLALDPAFKLKLVGVACTLGEAGNQNGYE